MTITETEALEAMRSHHRTLEDGLRVRVEALGRAAGDGRPHERATAALVAYLADEVLPHAEAEEHEAEHPGEFTWEYLQAGPAEWRVRIGHASARP